MPNFVHLQRGAIAIPRKTYYASLAEPTVEKGMKYAARTVRDRASIRHELVS